MKILLTTLVLSLLLVVPASAAYYQTLQYGWEDGTGTIVGSYGNLTNPTNVTGVQVGLKGDVPPLTWTCPGAHEGTRYLHVAENPHYGTPQAYLVCITGLLWGDTVWASYWGWDDEAVDPSPSLRIWAHYTDAEYCANCPGGYMGSAGEGFDNTGYTTGIGWEQMSAYWVAGESGAPYAGAKGMVIEMRLYSSPSTADSTTDYWADLVEVTIPQHARALFPDFGPTAVDETTWGRIKTLFR
jgi:hypothetical protein